MRTVVAIFCLSLWAGVPARVEAQVRSACEFPPALRTVRPDPEGTPTAVSAGIFMLDLRAIHDAEQSFEADVFLVLRWKDARLVSKDLNLAGCLLPLRSVWNPNPVVVNEREVERTRPDLVEVLPDGTVEYVQRYQGFFTAPLHLADFPFDEQRIGIQVVAGGVSPEEIRWERDEVTGGSGHFSIADWSVGSGRVGFEPYHLEPTGEDFAMVTFGAVATRKRGYYIQKLFLPLTLIILMSWAVFWIDPSLVPPQVGISTSAVLTLIAFLFSLSYLLPRLSYLTRADRFVIGATILVFCAFGEALLTTGLAGRERKPAALKIDRVARIAFPLALTAVFVYAFLL